MVLSRIRQYKPKIKYSIATAKQPLMFLILMFAIVSSYAQDLPVLQNFENLEELNFKDEFKGFFKDFKDAKPFDISGSVGLHTRSYGAFNTENRQSPFTWTFNSNINISIYKIKFPFSFLVSSQNQTYSHPFTRETVDNFLDRRYTRIGVSPYYKWVKLHAGHRSMNFSPLTVANRTFLGGGIELTPGNLRFAAFYGGMAKTDPQDRALFGFNKEIFSQKGLGIKVGYGKDQNFIDLIFFRARDEISASTQINQDSAYVFPNENAVLGLNGQWEIFDKVQLKFELATSGFTQNALDPENEDPHFPFPSFVLNRKTSTDYRKAINSSIAYNGKNFSIGLGYKRIEPEFKSLGAYFFNDDLEDYTLNFSFGLLENRLRVSGTGGVQRNNLFNDKSSQLLRTIAGINIGYFHNAFSIIANYSNNTSDIDYVLNPELDSLTAIIITQNASLTFNYSLATKEKGNRHNYMLNLSMQQVTDKIENPTTNAGSQMINAVFNYNLSIKESGWRINSMANYTHSELNQLNINRFGLGMGLQKSIVEDIWALAINANYFLSKGKNIDNQTVNLRLSSPFRISKEHRIDIGILYMTRTKSGTDGGNFHEISGTLGYTYNFSLKKDRKINKSKSESSINE